MLNGVGYLYGLTTVKHEVLTHLVTNSLKQGSTKSPPVLDRPRIHRRKLVPGDSHPRSVRR